MSCSAAETIAGSGLHLCYLIMLHEPQIWRKGEILLLQILPENSQCEATDRLIFGRDKGFSLGGGLHAHKESFTEASSYHVLR
jgi:hypothetical protein